MHGNVKNSPIPYPLPCMSDFVPTEKICNFAHGGEGLCPCNSNITTTIMAKGNFLTSIVRGKLGEMVGYANTNSNDKVKQAWRSYRPHISNPRTEGQARQRMIVSNLTKNYTALKEIITRGFEGTKYGGKSYQRFLSLNMKNAGQGPFIPKGTRSTPLPVPGMIISQGSLIPIDVLGFRVATVGTLTNVGFIINDLFASPYQQASATTWGYVSTSLISGNTDVKDGDQITFIEVCETENLEYVYRFKSVVIDSTSTDPVSADAETPSVKTYQGITFSFFVEGGITKMMVRLGIDPNEVPVAGAVIQSRQGSDGQRLRSPASMWVNEGNTDIMQYFSAEMYQLALESYMNEGKTTSTDWPVEPDAEITGAWAKTLTSVDINGEGVTGSVVCAAIANSELQLKLIVKTVEGVQYLTNSNGSIVVKNDIQITAAMLSGASANIPLVDITTLDEYNVTLSRSLEEPEEHTKKTKKS